MTTQATPQIGDLRFNNGRWERYEKDVLPGRLLARSDGWVPFDLPPDLTEVVAAFGFTTAREGEDGLEFFSDENGNWYTPDELQADYAAYQQELEMAGPAPEGWTVPWPPRYQDGDINWTQVQSARAQEQRALEAAQPEAEAPFFEQERDAVMRQQQGERDERELALRETQAATVTSLDRLAAQAAASGDIAKARAAIDLSNRPSPFSVMQLAVQFADNEAALKTIFDFAHINRIQIPGVTFPEDEPAQSPFQEQQPFQPAQAQPQSGLVWNGQTWERANQSALSRLGELDPQSAARLQREQDPTAFDLTGPPAGPFPGMPTPGASFEAAVGGEQGFNPLPVLPGQQPRGVPEPDLDNPFGVPLSELQRSAEADDLTQRIQQRGLLAPGITREQEFPTQPAEQPASPGAGSSLAPFRSEDGSFKITNPTTGQTIYGDETAFRNAGAGFQIEAPQRAAATAKPAAPDPFQQFLTAINPFKTVRSRQQSPFGTPHLARR